jgi:hypothetical protein
MLVLHYQVVVHANYLFRRSSGTVQYMSVTVL